MNYTSKTMLVKANDKRATGEFARVRADEVGWDFLNMSAMRLNKGERFGENIPIDFAKNCESLGAEVIIAKTREAVHERWKMPKRFKENRSALLPRLIDGSASVVTSPGGMSRLQRSAITRMYNNRAENMKKPK